MRSIQEFFDENATRYLDDDTRLNEIIKQSGYKEYKGTDFIEEHREIYKKRIEINEDS